jgi:peptide/nickel transport system substrate-binding protein
VIFTYETTINPRVDAANLANQYIDIDKVVKIDDRTVKFYLKRPYYKALQIASLTWDMGIFPKHIYQFDDPEEFNSRFSDPVGSGPYLFEKWETGKEVVLSRNENYWGQKPKLKKVIYRFISNDLAALQALRVHEVDILIPADPEQFADMVEDKEFNKEFDCLDYWTPWTPFYYIGWNQDTPFFKDKRVRQAMTHIIDREQIVTKLLKGHAKITTGPFYIYGPEYNRDIKLWPYDLEKAKELLDQAGWIDSDGDGIRDKDGIAFRFKFMYSTYKTLYQRIARLLKDDAAKIGIEVIPDPYEWSVLIPRLNDRKFDAMIMGWGGDILEDPYQIFHSSQIGNRGSNYVGFNNAKADELIERARRTIDDQTRYKLYHQLHSLLHDEQPYTFVFIRPTFRFVDRRFKNVNIHRLGLKYWEWYVPKEQQRYK